MGSPIDDDLGALAKLDERKSRVVELRFFGGLSVDQTAEALTVLARDGHARLEVLKGLVEERAATRRIINKISIGDRGLAVNF